MKILLMYTQQYTARHIYIYVYIYIYIYVYIYIYIYIYIYYIYTGMVSIIYKRYSYIPY